MLPRPYRRRPEAVLAVRFDGTPHEGREIAVWCEGQVTESPLFRGTTGPITVETVVIVPVMGGIVTARAGDWIVRCGERYAVVGSEAFPNQYEEILP